ncbi:MAG: BMP family ABC transporter substrate-binding protein, partial [Limnohabitans sp.]
MTDFSKRSALKMVALTAVAAAALVGCGKKEEAPKAEAPAAAKTEPLKVAFAYVGPVGD